MSNFVVKPRMVALCLGAVALFLVFCSTAVWVAHAMGANVPELVIKLFFLDEEKNFPTMFSSALLLLIAFLLAFEAIRTRHVKARYSSRWLLLAIGFLVMFADEAWSFHERLVDPMRDVLGGAARGFLYYPWVVPAIVLVLVLLIVFLGFLRHLPPATRRSFLVAAAVYLAGALGCELLGALIADTAGNQTNAVYVVIVTAEESLEMGGAILFMLGLLQHIARLDSRITVELATSSDEELSAGTERGTAA